MRPRRKVLLYCAEEGRGRELAYVLNLRGFAPYWCDGPETLAAVLRVNQFDAALVLDAGEPDHGESAVRAIRGFDPRLKVALALRGMSTIQTLATQVLAHDTGVSGLVEAVRVCCAHRPGPKPVLELAARAIVAGSAVVPA